jgi:aarF domain-containing kinase
LNRLVDKLGQMRGAALKLGQFLSIQESGALPRELEEVLRRVQAGADYMPDEQMQEILREDLGQDWRERFIDFNPIPIASASIGQVHTGTIPSSTAGADQTMPVAVKIQFPGVASSIASDLSNLSLLLTSSALLPKGLYLGSTIKAMRGELQDECDYAREADCARRFGRLLGVGERGEEGNLGGPFRVPRIVDELSTGRVLTMERMEGTPLSKVFDLPQEERDKVRPVGVASECHTVLTSVPCCTLSPDWLEHSAALPARALPVSADADRP